MSGSLAQRIADAGLDWVVPDWGAPATVHSLSTTRHGGVSTGARASLDLGGAMLPQHAGRDAILENRRRLMQFVPATPMWLSQVHGADAVEIDAAGLSTMSLSPPTADAAVTRLSGVVLAVRTADCLPVAFSDRAGTVVGVAHAGWRGLAAGVLEATVRAMRVAPDEILAWLGPAIGPQEFEVGSDVFDAFCAPDPGAEQFFAPYRGVNRLAADRDPKWLADIYGLARRRLGQAGVTSIAGGDHCTLTDSGRFFSYRADKDAGRMATLAWRDA